MKNVLPPKFLLSLAIFSALLNTCSDSTDTDRAERTKIALREVGNQLLLSDQDSTSLVLPVTQIEANKYRVSFEKSLTITPDSLVDIVERNLEKVALPKQYRVEVMNCVNQEVAYSYEMSFYEENTIIPCFGRQLPKNCYTIELKLKEESQSALTPNTYVYVSVLGTMVLIGFLAFKKKKVTNDSEPIEQGYTDIGMFRFYPHQHKLVKKSEEIGLSNKECELLELLSSSPNQVITRDELTKRIWEDNGVFVGRSLDTYVSKLRKKLAEDDTIQITNVHGVGYKLQII